MQATTLAGSFVRSLSPQRNKSERASRVVWNATFEHLESRQLLSTVPGGFSETLWGSAISNGTQMEFAPDGRLFVCTQAGQIRIITPNGQLVAAPALNDPGDATTTLPVDNFFERGLLGVAFDPQFNASAPGVDYIYLYYTVPSSAGGPNNRIARFEVNGDKVAAATQTTILNLNALGAGNHNGGGLHFGPDGKLYVGVGENATSSNAQNINNLLGKILRVNPDPANPIPSDNPTSFPGIIGSPTGNNRAIWAVGLRNPFTTAWSGNRYIINDVGQNTWEEVNDGVAGRNYGWPSTEGDFNQASFPNFTRPVYAYQHGSGVQRGNTIAGTAMMNSSINPFPAPYQGKYFFGDYINNWIAYVDFDAPPAVNNHTNFATGATGIVDMKVGPDGAMYWLGGGATGNGVRRILPTPPSPVVNNGDFLFDGVSLPSAPHRLQFTFNTNVFPSLTTSDLVLTNTTTSTSYLPGDFALSYDYATNVATFTFPGLPSGILPDGNYTATLSGAGVSNALGQTLAGDEVENFFVLAGDANHDTFVNANDFSILATNFGQSGRIFSQGDFNYDGIVNANDFSILATKFGTSLAPATASKPRGVLAAPATSLFASDQKIGQTRGSDSRDLLGLLA